MTDPLISHDWARTRFGEVIQVYYWDPTLKRWWGQFKPLEVIGWVVPLWAEQVTWRLKDGTDIQSQDRPRQGERTLP